MKPWLTRFLHVLKLYHPLHDLRREYRFRSRESDLLRAWERNGKPVPPPASIKHLCILRYSRKWRIRVLVETGTWFGDTVFMLRREFKGLHSIELDEELFRSAKEHLGHIRNIRLHHGDSAQVLPVVVAEIQEPVLYWLDGHFCAGPSARGAQDSPISEELSFLLERTSGENVVLIDDARLFVGADGYPTLADLRALVARKRPRANFIVADDIVQIAPV